MEIKEGFVICDSYKKEEIIRNSKGFKNYIFLSFNDLSSRVLGSCKKEAIFLLVDKYSLSYEEAKEYIKYIPYVENKSYNNLKLDSIVSAKNLLIENNLFSKDDFFLFRLNQFPVTFIDVDDNILARRIKDIIKDYTEVIEYNSCENEYKPLVYEFNDIYDECLYVFNEVAELYKKGISLNKIFINNVDSSYSFIFRRLSRSYNIPINLPNDKNISSLEIANEFIRLCDIESTFSDILDKLDKESDYYNTIMNLIVDYNLEDKDPKKYKDFFSECLIDAKFKASKYSEMLSCTEKKHYSDDEYVFLVGLNLGSLPKVYKDDEYLNDNELHEISLLTSVDKNIDSKMKLKKLMLESKNICISYKRYAESEECFPSNIIGELNLDIEYKSVKYGYSRCEDNLRLGSAYTRFIKYNDLNEALEKYDINDLKFNSYDNSYTQIDRALLNERFKEKPLKMAYSNIKTFFGCPFQYFADRILGLNEFKPNMAARLGTFSHAVLEDSYNEDFDFNESARKNKLELLNDSRDKFYFTVMEEVLRDLIAYNREHEELSMLKNIEREAHIEYHGDGYIFEGYIDKLMYTEINNEIYAAIVDYKTGKDIVSLDNVIDGFNLQLPCYMYLLNKYERFNGKKIHIIGIYLQKVNIISIDNTIDISKQREKAFKLQGFTIRSHELISMLDPNYDKSSYLNKMSTLKSGDFSRYADVISEDKMNELVLLVEDMINKANREIKNGSFNILSKNIEGKNSACTFCSYKDLCFKSAENMLYLTKKSFLEEKDGDENGLD